MPTTHPRLRRMAGNLALAAISMLIVCAVAEYFCRRFGWSQRVVLDALPTQPAPGSASSLEVRASAMSAYRFTRDGAVRLAPSARIIVKNSYLSHRDIEIRTNSLGFRGPEPGKKQPGQFRILVLGDSITLGHYLTEAETYPARIQAHLAAPGPKPGPTPGQTPGPTPGQTTALEVLSAGIGSVDTETEYHNLRLSGLQAEPDVVLVQMYLNDGEPSPHFTPRPLHGLLGASHLLGLCYQGAQLAWHEWQHRAEMRGERREWIEAFRRTHPVSSADWRTDPTGFHKIILESAQEWGAAWSPLAWQKIEGALRKIQALAAAHHARVGLVIFPVRYQVEASYLSNEPQQIFASLAARLGLPHEDMLPVLRAAWAKRGDGASFFYDHCHPTPDGMDVAARQTAEFLVRAGLVPEGTALAEPPPPLPAFD